MFQNDGQWYLLELGNARLLELADLLDTVDAYCNNAEGLPSYMQSDFRHRCGSPSCALGWWADAHKDRWEWERGSSRVPTLKEVPLHSIWKSTQVEFQITDHESVQLFGSHGCDDAMSGKQAATYIRQFVEQRR